MVNNKRQGNMNVLFITFDDLRPALGCYNDPLAITPNIDRLAERSVIFTRAYCQQAVCGPSRASMLTGLRPDEIGVTDLKANFREKNTDIVTLPQIFKKNGYAAVNVGKVYHGARSTQDGLSWSVPETFNISEKREEYYASENRTGQKEASMEFPEVPDNAYIDGKIANEANGWLEKFEASDTPFFLAIGFQKPHFPFCAPRKYWNLTKKKSFKLSTNQKEPVNAPSMAFHNWQELRGYSDIPDQGNITALKAEKLRRAYYSCVSYVDVQVGKIMAKLHDLGLHKNTIIVLCSDHGIHLGEQNLWGKATNFERSVNIPLIISAPGVSQRGGTCSKIVESLDIYPTLIDLCQIKPMLSLTGKSLRPFLIDTEMPSNANVAYSQFCRPYDAIFSDKKAKYIGYSIRCKDWRCTAWYHLQSGSIEFRELYHLKDSHIEKMNVSGDTKYATIESHLLKMLDDYRNMDYTG